MNKIKKVLLLIPVLGILQPTIPCQAKIENTTEVQLQDMGHGIIVPTSFDVKNADGSFATLSGINLADWQEQEVDENNYSITLDNGYRAEKYWLYTNSERTKGYKCIVVYNQNNESVFSLGRSGDGPIVCAMEDEAGNQMKNTYTHNVLGEKGSTYLKTEVGDDGDSIRPLERITHDADSNTRKVYTLYDKTMKLCEKYEYDRDGGVCTFYNLCKSDDYSGDDEYYESCSYKKDDLREYTFDGPMYNAGTGKEYFGTAICQMPSVITEDGQEKYLYKVCTRDTSWSTPEERELMKGKVAESACYFTKEQIEVLEAENLKYGEDIMEKYPEFFFSSTREPEHIMGDGAVSEAAQKGIDAVNAITPTQIEEENTEEDTYTTNGSTFFAQELTGDVVPINGQTPTMLVTYVKNTPVGEQIYIELTDDNYNMIASTSVNDLGHTKYKYIYLTMLDVSTPYAFFTVAGTDTAMSGNLNYSGEVTTDTEYGEQSGSVYTSE